MSQIISASISNIPSVPTQFTTDSGVAVPVSNNLNVIGDNGIVTVGSGDTVTVKFNQDTITTTDVETATVLTVTPTDDSTTTYQILIDGFDVGNACGIGGQLIATVKKIGGAVTVIGTPDDVKNGDVLPVVGVATISDADFTTVASGADLIVQVTGVLGFTIVWKAITAGVT